MPDRTVDLRSDTLTQPTPEMMEAIASAPLGDDCYGEDPTVLRLQEVAAAKVGSEAALFVPTGTMANSCALLAHTQAGDEVIFEEFSHMYNWECGAFANVAGLAARTLSTPDGIVRPDQLDAAIRPYNPHFAPPTLVCIENTHNNHAGIAWSPAQVEALAAVAHERGAKLHMDGARIFNAALAHNAQVSDYTRHLDSLMFCVSKGLSAPVGSLLCGSRAFIDAAYPMRKRLGGAMRQVGVIAAAGIVALEQMVDRLAEDHANAQTLAAGLSAIEGIEAIYPKEFGTNILLIDVAGLGWSTADIIDKWTAHGIRCNPRPPSRVRLLTHRHINADDVQYVIDVTKELVS